MLYKSLLFMVAALLVIQTKFKTTQCKTYTQNEVKLGQPNLVNASNFDLEHEKKKCIENGCSEKSTNGKCDEECNRYACNFDGYECSLGIDPWKNCSTPVDCSEAFMNGKCDEACNNAQCLFDGRDCEKRVEPCPPVYETYCRKHYASGFCDYGCNTAGCDWDGFDCDWSPPDIAEGSFSVVVHTDDLNFRRNAVVFSRDIGLQLRASVRVRKDEAGKDMIFPWEGGRSNTTGVIVHLEIDNRKCSALENTACFSTGGEAAAYLAAMEAKKSLVKNFPIGK